jgi:hypothetical protein
MMVDSYLPGCATTHQPEPDYSTVDSRMAGIVDNHSATTETAVPEATSVRVVDNRHVSNNSNNKIDTDATAAVRAIQGLDAPQ